MERCSDHGGAAMRANEGWLRTVFDQAPSGMALIAPDGRYVQVNRALCEMLGYDEHELLSRTFQSITHPADLAEGEGALRQLMAGELRAFETEKRYIRKDGHAVWTMLSVSMVPDDRGLPVWFIAQVQDITERKHAEAALKESDERHRALFDRNPHPMWVFDVETLAIVAVNAAAVERYGYTRDEFLRLTILDLRPTEDVPAMLARRMVPGDGRSRPRTYRHRRKDGSIIWVDVVSDDVRADGRAARLVLASDITERVRAESEVRTANETLQSLIDLAPQAIIAVDLASLVTRWNRAAEQLFGWTAAEVLGGPLPYVPPEMQRGIHPEEALEIQASGVRGVALQRMTKDGRRVDVLLSSGVLRDASGSPTGYIAVLSDLTEHKALEVQLRQAQKMEAVGQLAGGVAHDFNNLLTVIRVHAELLLDQMQRTMPEYDDVAEIRTAANRAAALTRQLLAFSRKQLLKPQVLDLNATVTGLVPMLERLIGEDIEIVTRLEPALGRVTADPAQLEQVLVNLVVNARDAMPHGGVLVIETANVDVDDGHRPPSAVALPAGAYVMLAVRDSGVGMDANTQARIFEPFFTTKESGKGTGLGLSTVYGTVKQSGGYIDVNSMLGRGTVFHIHLPRVAAERPARVADPASRPTRGMETVLLVEDEDAVRRLTCRVLEEQGYTVIEARHGRDALQVAAERGAAERIDLVVTDVVMPVLSGPELADELSRRRAGLKVLFMSGYTDDEIIRRGLLEPGVALLEKPFTPQGLLRMVREVLDSDSRGVWPAGGG